MKAQNFFKPKKSLDEVIHKFEELGVPAKKKRAAVRNALVNDTRKKESTLKATKEGNSGLSGKTRILKDCLNEQSRDFL